MLTTILLLLSQAPLVVRCGNNGTSTCVGTLDGGIVRLNENVTVSKGTVYIGDGGAGPELTSSTADIKPTQSATPIRLLGNQSRTSTTPDVIIGTTTARDGGVPVVRFVSGTTTIGQLSGSGVLTVSGVSNGGAESVSLLTVISDAGIGGNLGVAGNELLTGTLGVGGVTTLVALDAGVGSKVGGVSIAVGSAQDGGLSTTPLMQWGYGAMTAGELPVTFTRAFSANPSCVCGHTQTTNANACGIKTGTAASTTAVTFAVASGDTDNVYWQCMGDK